MGITERKDRERQEMRAKILEAAAAMFIQDGYEKTSLRGIAEKIEYSVGTIYLYFKDKTDLFHELMSQGFQKLLDKLAHMQNLPDTNPVGALREVALLYMNFAAENPSYYDLMFIMRKPMEMVHDEHDFQAGTDSLEVLQSILAACIAQKRVRYENAEIGAMLCWSTLHGLISLYHRKRLIMIECKVLTPFTMDNFLKDAVDAYLKAIIIEEG
ncbi:transcriptional regulator, TetR family [Chitinophaga costaii]|uniref:Transcriptional regulator, TetR family n=1 Tax=Chitinophaga costaii TaxID=1335309 RepID=A0A1C4CAU9_9BACT|nr:TetR/AcrR family transcriptional regulator [Chitinophaga costaii]PUZ27163.1 TetR/AcrR family transcriptional regulator [Chitinophaga costaii]SCC16241.1 transcriptional regulator, TetR family [Chitinophaga costaii]